MSGTRASSKSRKWRWRQLREFDFWGPVCATGRRRITCFGRGHMAVRNHLVTSSVVMRHEVAARVGEFDAQLRGPEDHDYWLRATEVTRVGRVDAALTGYRRTAGSLSTQTATMEA